METGVSSAFGAETTGTSGTSSVGTKTSDEGTGLGEEGFETDISGPSTAGMVNSGSSGAVAKISGSMGAEEASGASGVKMAILSGFDPEESDEL
jgi:hypothetical protein